MRKMNNKSITSMLKVTLAALLMVPTILAVPVAEVADASPIINVSSGALTAPPPSEPTIDSLAATQERGHIYQAVGALIPGEDFLPSSIRRQRHMWK